MVSQKLKETSIFEKTNNHFFNFIGASSTFALILGGVGAVIFGINYLMEEKSWLFVLLLIPICYLVIFFAELYVSKRDEE